MLKDHEQEWKEKAEYDAWLKEQDRIGQENIKAMQDRLKMLFSVDND